MSEFRKKEHIIKGDFHPTTEIINQVKRCSGCVLYVS